MRTTLFRVAIIGAFTALPVLAVQHEHQAEPGIHMSMMGADSMMFKDASFSIVDTADGVAVTVTTQTGDVEKLRQTVETMGTMHQTPSHRGMHPNTIPFNVKFEAIEGGGRLTLTPENPEDVAALRVQVRKHTEKMQTTNGCPGMDHTMGLFVPGESHHPSGEVR